MEGPSPGGGQDEAVLNAGAAQGLYGDLFDDELFDDLSDDAGLLDATKVKSMALCSALDKADIDGVRAVLASGADPNAKIHLFCRPVEFGRHELTWDDMSLCRGEAECTPLYVFVYLVAFHAMRNRPCKSTDAGIVEAMLAASLDPATLANDTLTCGDSDDPFDGLTLLIQAACAGLLPIAELLMRHGADPDRTAPNMGIDAWKTATQFEHGDIVTMFEQVTGRRRGVEVLISVNDVQQWLREATPFFASPDNITVLQQRVLDQEMDATALFALDKEAFEEIFITGIEYFSGHSVTENGGGFTHLKIWWNIVRAKEAQEKTRAIKLLLLVKVRCSLRLHVGDGRSDDANDWIWQTAAEFL